MAQNGLNIAQTQPFQIKNVIYIDFKFIMFNFTDLIKF